MKIAITGATGQLGELVIQNLLKQTKAENIIALVRDFDKAQALKQQGVELRLFDYDQPETLILPCKGLINYYLFLLMKLVVAHHNTKLL